MIKNYKRSMNCLKMYISIIKTIPSEKEWNRYAIIENLLSSKSLGYYNKKTFNKLCKDINRSKK